MNTCGPLDIKPEWLNVARRMQSVSGSQGYSIVTMNILCDASGRPVMWTEPQQLKIEPKAANADAIIKALIQSLGASQAPGATSVKNTG